MKRVVLALSVAAVLSACYSPTLPLPPPARDGLSVSPPDADGMVLVEGEAGVMEAGDQAVIINLSTLYGWIVPVDEEGAFSMRVEAESGDWLSIQRRSGYESSPAVEVLVPEG